MQIVRPVAAAVGGVGQGVRDLARLQQVVAVAVRHGFGILVAGLKLPGLPRIEATFDSNPERAVAALQELGPTFVKLGQILSTRPDLIPEAWCTAFEALQDDAAPLDPAEIQATLAENLGANLREQVEWFDDEPLATASIAQVHRARTRAGQEVVLKVRRAGVAQKIRSDLNILQVLARALLSEFPESRAFDPRGILAEFERSILAEIEFKREAENTRRFARNFEGDARVRIPYVVDELSSDGVLCLEFLDGVPIRKARESGADMHLVGERYLGVAYDMLFIHGFFHCDLHPGNVLVLPGGVLGLLDFGMTGSLTPEMRAYILTIIVAAQRRDHHTLARLFFDIAIKERRVDWAAVDRDTVEILERNLVSERMEDIDVGRLVRDLTAAASRHGARIPLSYTMFFKALLTTEGLARTLLQEQNPVAAAEPYFRRMVLDSFSKAAVEQELTYQAVALGPLARRLPLALTQLLDDFDAARLGLIVRHEDDPTGRIAADRRVNRQILAAWTAICFLCGAITVCIPPVSFAFMAGGTVLGVMSFVAILRPLPDDGR
jgi:ubiquinone biosynthesis protein